MVTRADEGRKSWLFRTAPAASRYLSRHREVPAHHRAVQLGTALGARASKDDRAKHAPHPPISGLPEIGSLSAQVDWSRLAMAHSLRSFAPQDNGSRRRLSSIRRSGWLKNTCSASAWLTPCLSMLLRLLPSSQSKPSIPARSISATTFAILRENVGFQFLFLRHYADFRYNTRIVAARA